MKKRPTQSKNNRTNKDTKQNKKNKQTKTLSLKYMQENMLGSNKKLNVPK